ncbi:septal ring lytic transglycosylase RlpA family protein [Roseomonas populi]|uniref:Endolytic peptidoglycan transglycosylase RlpA n=1 Tax=Roseomonas populi TaxID=3121582 RepID=A0ABT1X043_9PROT|nr:septal ring lytic transglycosylase RlpA family protein [Roseomonas pecuniae]MCR0981472.1 septal ring lytic transglycosylase RlpA family protein [Roseomonas pecuniae]
MRGLRILLACVAGLLALPDSTMAADAHRAHPRLERQRHHQAAHKGEHREARHRAHHRTARLHPRRAQARAAGHTQRGHASVYARSLAGRRMADGSRFDPGASIVASRTLPLGSHARVTNLRNGRSVIVQVRDRGPHRGRRIVDLSPGVASRLGMAGGTAPVTVTPLLLASRAEAAPARRR